MTKDAPLNLSWHEEPFGEVFWRAASDVGEEFDLYVESLDGICDPEHVRSLLVGWGFARPDATSPVIPGEKPLRLLLGDERYFPGYDTVWAVEKGRPEIEPPPFLTWLATESEGRAPGAKESPLSLLGWEEVAAWMGRNGVLFGVSRGVYVLLIALREGT